MAFATFNWIRVSARVSVFVLLAVSPLVAETATFTFSGEITEVILAPLPPFEGVVVGDVWTLSYSFELLDALDVDPSDTAGQYRATVNDMTLTIGESTVSGAPDAAVPSGPFTSVIFVNMGAGYADYSAQVGLPGATAWSQISLSDDSGTPFTTDELPQLIPTPYDVMFPDARSFFLRKPGTTELFLRGVMGGFETGTQTKVRADLEVEMDDSGLPTLSLLLNSELFGYQGVLLGSLSCPGCEVMGVEPSPFVWFVDPDSGEPISGEPVLSFRLDNPGGEVMGVEPSPFRLLLDYGGEGFGEMDFSQATGYFPGPLGSLYLEGVRVDLGNDTVVALEGFEVYDAVDKVFFNGMRIDRDTIDAPEVVGFVTASDDEDAGVLASGWLSCPGCEVMGVEPSPFKWLARDSELFPPPDGTRVVAVELDPAGAVSGVEPSPFLVYLSSGGEVLGEVDFGTVGGYFPGTLGSLALDHLSLILPDGSSLGIDYFESFDRNDQLALIDTRIDLVIETMESTRVSLVVNSTRYGVGGFGSGSITSPGSEVMGVEPSPFRWIVDPDTGTPDDYEAVVSYVSVPGEEVMGVEPSPFRYLVVDGDGVALGSIDFSESVGVWGSFHLEGVDVLLADGSTIEVQSFETFYRVNVGIDVKPGDETNTVNLGSAGVIPVAILSSSTFDANTVDPMTISLAGASVKLVGNGTRYLAQREDVDGDGLDDLLCHILTEEVAIEAGESVVVLEASTFGGLAIIGQDYIRIVP